MALSETFMGLVQLVGRLRGECPWDREQNPLTIAQALVDEAYELLEGASAASWPSIQEELGDLFFQLIMIATMAEEANAFQMEDALASVAEKLRRRHPHVFGASDAKTADEVASQWEIIKAEEKAKAPASPHPEPTDSSLRDALLLQSRARKLGFDWPGPEGVVEKALEEAEELKHAMARKDPRALGEELGDMLFTMVNLARHLRLDPERALRAANQKFSTRFSAVEAEMARRGTSMSLEEMEEVWQAQKPKPEGKEQARQDPLA